jgi:hypothetical protein
VRAFDHPALETIDEVSEPQVDFFPSVPLDVHDDRGVGPGEDELVDRSAWPWGSPLRRLSHADKRQA